MEQLTFEYSYVFNDGREEIFTVNLDPESFDLLDLPPDELPEWTRLGFQRCFNCPLDPTYDERCPLAVSLVRLVQRMGEVTSFEPVSVEVHTGERTMSRTTSAQEGMSSLMGLLVASSGCPHTAFFRPMARFHLPFANTDETIYRAASMYLLAQYFRDREGMPADLDFEGLLDIYAEVETVNKAMAQRLRKAHHVDGGVNAIVLLDMFAKNMPVAIDDSLEALRGLFLAYLKY